MDRRQMKKSFVTQERKLEPRCQENECERQSKNDKWFRLQRPIHVLST